MKNTNENNSYFNEASPSDEQLDKLIHEAARIHREALLTERFQRIDKKHKRAILIKRGAVVLVSLLVFIGLRYVYYQKIQELIPTDLEENAEVIYTPKQKDSTNISTLPPAHLEERKGTQEIKKAKNNPEKETQKETEGEISTTSNKVFALGRKPIEEQNIYGGENDEIEFSFRLDTDRHLQAFLPLQAAFIAQDYATAQRLLAELKAKNKTNEELQLFSVVLHFLSKQQIQPFAQIDILAAIQVSSLKTDVNWCKAYAYYSIRRKKEAFEVIDNLAQTPYENAALLLKQKLE